MMNEYSRFTQENVCMNPEYDGHYTGAFRANMAIKEHFGVE